jgi:hypothetical protein
VKNPEVISQGWTANQLQPADTSFHNWYRFVLSFPPHLVRTYIEEFNLDKNQTLLDPFAGTGTTLIEAKLLGIPSIGVEANPFASFASSVKVDWDIDWRELEFYAKKISNEASKIIREENGTGPLGLRGLDNESNDLLIKNSINSQSLHKTLILKGVINQNEGKPFHPHFLLALAKSTVFSVSNLRFGPEVGVGKMKSDADVVMLWLHEVGMMVEDLKKIEGVAAADSQTFCADSRDLSEILLANSIDAVITSPPYPNEKDYSRTTRLESVLLEFIKTRRDLKNVKKTLIRSNTRNIYRDDDDYKWIEHQPEIETLAQKIELRRKELGKTSGFERLYPKVTREYFGGMARHLGHLRSVLKPGARLAYVVGDQASYLRVMIRTGQILGKIAGELGYKLERIDLFRERFATATKDVLREEVVILTWDGKSIK